MTNRDDMTLTSSGFYVSQEAPISCENPTPTPTVPAQSVTTVPTGIVTVMLFVVFSTDAAAFYRTLSLPAWAPR